MAVDPHGDIIPTLDSTRAEGDDFRWNHTVNVIDDQAVEPGDYFTIHDFGNLIPGLNVSRRAGPSPLFSWARLSERSRQQPTRMSST